MGGFYDRTKTTQGNRDEQYTQNHILESRNVFAGRKPLGDGLLMIILHGF